MGSPFRVRLRCIPACTDASCAPRLAAARENSAGRLRERRDQEEVT